MRWMKVAHACAVGMSVQGFHCISGGEAADYIMLENVMPHSLIKRDPFVLHLIPMDSNQ